MNYAPTTPRRLHELREAERFLDLAAEIGLTTLRDARRLLSATIAACELRRMMPDREGDLNFFVSEAGDFLDRKGEAKMEHEIQSPHFIAESLQHISAPTTYDPNRNWAFRERVRHELRPRETNLEFVARTGLGFADAVTMSPEAVTAFVQNAMRNAQPSAARIRSVDSLRQEMEGVKKLPVVKPDFDDAFRSHVRHVLKSSKETLFEFTARTGLARDVAMSKTKAEVEAFVKQVEAARAAESEPVASYVPLLPPTKMRIPGFA